VDRSPVAFLEHADRMLSVALQTGNACIAKHGVADGLHQAHRRTDALASAPAGLRGRQQRVAAAVV
jgi:hypothetical protein